MAKKETIFEKKIEFIKEKPTSNHKKERPVSSVYREIDNDLARDNLENDIPDADLQDL